MKDLEFLLVLLYNFCVILLFFEFILRMILMFDMRVWGSYVSKCVLWLGRICLIVFRKIKSFLFWGIDWRRDKKNFWSFLKF